MGVTGKHTWMADVLSTCMLSYKPCISVEHSCNMHVFTYDTELVTEHTICVLSS